MVAFGSRNHGTKTVSHCCNSSVLAGYQTGARLKNGSRGVDMAAHLQLRDGHQRQCHRTRAGTPAQPRLQMNTRGTPELKSKSERRVLVWFTSGSHGRSDFARIPAHVWCRKLDPNRAWNALLRAAARRDERAVYGASLIFAHLHSPLTR